MAKVTWKPGTLLAPVPPALVSCGTLEKPNVLTIAWTGILNTNPALTYISVRPSRYSYELIKQSGEFVINLTTVSLVRAADLCGIRSGADVNKWKLANLTPEPSQHISAPRIAQSPINVECRVKQILPLGSHDMFIAEIVGIGVDERLIDRKEKLHLEQADLAAFAHGEYYELGKSLGTFGFSVKKKTNARRP